MQAITLYERVVLRRSNTLSLSLPGSPVAANDSNTAIKAAIAFFRYTGLLAGVDITIYKNVPGPGRYGGRQRRRRRCAGGPERPVRGHNFP